MREAIDIYGDKEHITQVSRSYVFFRFPDGNQDRKKFHKADLKDLYEWVKSEMDFYNRMYQELHNEYEKQKERFDRVGHYYSEEEIKEACKRDRFAYIDMEIRNKERAREWGYVVGISKEAGRINDKYWKYYRLAAQIEAVYKEL